MINNVAYDFPSVAYLEEGLYIIRYIPKQDYKFSHWQSIGLDLTKSESETPNQISVHQSGELRAFYVKLPRMRIERPSTLCDTIFSESPIKLEAEITSSDQPVSDAEVTFYINGEWLGNRFTDADGYACIDFEPPQEGVYTWYVTAERSGYFSETCDEWQFAFNQITLNPQDNETVSTLPIGLSALISLDGTPVKDASVFFYLDDEYRSEALTQVHGYAAYLIEELAPGPHTWYVTAWIPGYDNRFSSKTLSFTYRPELRVSFVHSENGTQISEVGSAVELRIVAISTNKVASGANCSFFVEGTYAGSALSDDRGVASLDFYPPKENMTYDWYVTATKPGHTNETSKVGSFHYPFQPPYIEVDRVLTSMERADIGSVQEIKFHLRWKNGSDVSGAEVRITDDHVGTTDEFGWVNFEVTSGAVCEKQWEMVDVTCEGMGELIQDNHPKIIWDRVNIELTTNKERVDIGENASLIEKAYYEYDNTAFSGSIIYNEELYADKACKKTIRVENIEDKKHNLMAFSSNEIILIWDRVNLHLDIKDPRVQVGKVAEITYMGSYEYDNSPFEGRITLDRSLKQDGVGKKRYTVERIEDYMYNLSSFTSDDVTCIFDDLEFEQEISTAVPTQAHVETRIYYAYDHKPVENADVKVNGIGYHTGSGIYESALFSFFPLMKIKTEIKLGGFETRTFETETVNLGNIGLLSGIAVIIFLLLGRKYLKSHSTS